jgi:hypothetical protein
MLSRADKPRGAGRERAEFALRTVALGALVLSVLFVSGAIQLGGNAKRGAPLVVSTSPGRAAVTPLLQAVRNLLTADAPRRLHFVASRVPADSARALLTAALEAGVPVAWTDSTRDAAVAVEASAVVDPNGGVALRATAPSGVLLQFRDSLGLIDSVHARAGGASFTVGHVVGTVAAETPGARATTAQPAPVLVRRLLVIANAGWEAKFTVAALEERGWGVDVRYALGRNVAVTQGDPRSADTVRYAAVVALDSSARPHAAELRRYALSGGGVVIAGAATTLRELGDLLAGRAGNVQPGIPGALATDTPLDGVSWRGIAPDSNAIVLARSTRRKTGANATIVARRFGAGSVVEVAYEDVWEWRMSGPDGSVTAHRNWWSALVSTVAFAPIARDSRANARPGNAAPYADFVARLGAPTAAPARAVVATTETPWDGILLVLAVFSLVLEWASRRLRGAR